MLAAAQAAGAIVQDYRPLAESIDWELGKLYWRQTGNAAFLADGVPYAINNDGGLSASAAELLFASLAESDARLAPDSPIRVLEIGVGTGLFARLFLDAFAALCRQTAKNYYERLQYVAADLSQPILDNIVRHGVLARHQRRCVFVQADANALEATVRPDNANAPLSGPFHAILLNYLLDQLPASVLRLSPHVTEQLCVQTCIPADAPGREFTDLSRDEIARRANSACDEDKLSLVPLYPLFRLRFAFLPVDVASLPYRELIPDARDDRVFYVHNHGALRCVERLLPRLAAGGWLLINDFGSTGDGATVCDDSSWIEMHQRYGGSTQIGLNFRLLKTFFESQQNGLAYFEPEGDNEHIVSRLAGGNMGPTAVAAFRERFGKDAFEQRYAPVQRARDAVRRELYERALAAFADALKQQPWNWCILEEAARLVAYRMGQWQAGLEMTQEGLELNPISPELWNIRGDCLFALEKWDKARAAFAQALRVKPGDVQAHYNLIYCDVRDRDYATALRRIADALFWDASGEFRTRLLERQTEILARIGDREKYRLRSLSDRAARRITP